MKRVGALLLLLFAGIPTGVQALSRTEIVESAPAYEEHEWVCTEDNLTAWCVDDTWVPAVTEVGPQVGIPYCWAGSVTVEEFDQQIAQGYGAGTDGSAPIFFIGCTAGLDCSGYVSRLWQFPDRFTTREVDLYSAEVAISELLPADIFNRYDSHMILYVGEAPNGDAIVTESTTAPECMGVCRRTLPWSHFDEYTPRTYLYLDVTSSTQAGTLEDPIPIEAFPFTDENSTRSAQSDQFDVYSAAPDTDESGPERIYVFHAASGGTLTANVLSSIGADIDIHLLSAPDQDACLARGDVALVHEITGPGTYYLVADTYVGDSGHQYSGSYMLHADFDGTLKEPDGDEPGESGCSCGSTGNPGRSLGFLGLLLLGLALRRENA